MSLEVSSDGVGNRCYHWWIVPNKRSSWAECSDGERCVVCRLESRVGLYYSHETNMGLYRHVPGSVSCGLFVAVDGAVFELRSCLYLCQVFWPAARMSARSQWDRSKNPTHSATCWRHRRRWWWWRCFCCVRWSVRPQLSFSDTLGV